MEKSGSHPAIRGAATGAPAFSELGLEGTHDKQARGGHQGGARCRGMQGWTTAVCPPGGSVPSSCGLEGSLGLRPRAGHTVALRANLQARCLSQEVLGEEGVGRNGEEGEEGEGVFAFQSVSYTWSLKPGGSVSPALRTGVLCSIGRAHSRCSIKVGTNS